MRLKNGYVSLHFDLLEIYKLWKVHWDKWRWTQECFQNVKNVGQKKQKWHPLLFHQDHKINAGILNLHCQNASPRKFLVKHCKTLMEVKSLIKLKCGHISINR
jgi:hypothetical protein